MYHQKNCVLSKRLFLICYWFSDTFSLYDLIVTWSFDIIVRINCFIKWIAFTEFLKTSRYRWLFKSNVSSKNLHLFVIDFDTFSLHDLFVLSMSMFCNWFVNSNSEIFFSLLNWIFFLNKTKCQRINVIDSNFKLCTFKNIVIFRVLIYKFDLSLKNSNKLSSWNEIL